MDRGRINYRQRDTYTDTFVPKKTPKNKKQKKTKSMGQAKIENTVRTI